MKKVIDGKRYDTETAIKVASVLSGDLFMPTKRIFEVLHRKKNGEYFLHVEGGAETRYAKAGDKRHWWGVEKIVPLTFEAARAWAKENLPDAEYAAAFGEVMDTGALVALNVNLNAAASDKLRRMASAEKTTIRAILERLIMGA